MQMRNQVNWAELCTAQQSCIAALAGVIEWHMGYNLHISPGRGTPFGCYTAQDETSDGQERRSAEVDPVKRVGVWSARGKMCCIRRKNTDSDRTNTHVRFDNPCCHMVARSCRLITYIVGYCIIRIGRALSEKWNRRSSFWVRHANEHQDACRQPKRWQRRRACSTPETHPETHHLCSESRYTGECESVTVGSGCAGTSNPDIRSKGSWRKSKRQVDMRMNHMESEDIGTTMEFLLSELERNDRQVSQS